ncbi:glycosyl transferase family 90 [Telmatospirillum sp.]|uniref:glycosyl transferase family 90 n=1 Tax=Telmatospirillum sp. TaxID=2079197 RepID=UPI00283D5F6C|nr:glycosyl transferase family 90 [Telmatospirillum sp.]MDR3438058.1 glycosyl transferase family 90 [Telmatospirillum sp.]
MANDFLEVSRSLIQLAQLSVSLGKNVDAVLLYEQAFSAALMQNSAIPTNLKMLPGDGIPGLASPEHVVAHISRSSITILALCDFLAFPCSDFRRFPVIGHVCSEIAKTIITPDVYECVFDIGDGNDAGTYDRVAYSSARPGTKLIVDPYFYFYNSYNALREHVASRAKPWKDRRDIVFWRGTTTGRPLWTPAPGDPPSWGWLPRLQLCAASRQSRHADHLDIGVSEIGQLGAPHLQEAVRQAGLQRPGVAKREFLEYRYLVDIDGFSNSWSLVEKLIMGATIFKVQSAGGYRQSFYDKLIPWETHIPVAADCSDLDEKVAWALDNPDDCERIAANAAALGNQLRLPAMLADAQASLWSILTPVG